MEHLSQVLHSKWFRWLLLASISMVGWLLTLQIVFPVSTQQVRIDRTLPDITTHDWQWFTYNKVVQQEQRKPIKRSQIKADLVGLIYTDERRVALISTQKKSLAVYTEGSEIEPGFRLKIIEYDRVIIDEHGEDRELRMQQDINQLLVEQTKKTEEQEGDSEPKAQTERSSEQFTEVEQIDNNQFSEYVDVIKVKVSDSNDGLFLKTLDPFITEISGINASDIIVDVDDQSIFDIMGNNQKVMELLGKESVTINVVRDGQQIPVNINVKDVSSKLLPLLSVK